MENMNNRNISEYKMVASKSQTELMEKEADPTRVEFNQLRLSNQLTDAVVSCCEGSFQVHRAMLSASSSYFRAQFTEFNVHNDANSAEHQEVFIPGMSLKILKELVDYAYLNKCNITRVNIFEMLVSADYIGMTGLITECTKRLEEMLTPENCVSTMKFAKFRFLDALYISARRYVLFNFPAVLQHKREILDLNVDEFFEIMADDQLNVSNEDIVWYFIRTWVEHDPRNRRRHIAHLLKAVRTGLMTPSCFMDDLKEHPFVRACPQARQLIVDTFRFMYELDTMNRGFADMITPYFAMPRLPNEVIFAIGGWSRGVAKNVIETYDTRADRWVVINAGDPAGPRAYHGTAVLGTEIYFVGGYDGVQYFNTCRVFDAALKTWREISPMHTRRCYVSCAQINGLIYAIGGFDGQIRLNSVERYNPQTNQWTMIAPMVMQRSDASACTLNGRIYAIGGFNGEDCLNTAEFYNPVINAWSPIQPMRDRRSGVACVAFRGSIYAIGGFNGANRLYSGERYDLGRRRWYPICDMNKCRSNFGLSVVDDMIFAIGGFNGLTPISFTECYIVETNEWLETCDLNKSRSAVTANTITNLPNVREYIGKDRALLMEERRLRLFNFTGIVTNLQPYGHRVDLGEDSEEEEYTDEQVIYTDELEDFEGNF